jgi:phosphomannomutase
MRVSPEIFRTYDIRGIYPSQINEETAYCIGRAFVKFLNPRQSFVGKKLKIVVGRDNRLSSPQLFNALTKGIIDQGANAIDIGLATTPMLYFAVAHFKFDGGVEISASHNPPEYNGFKLVRENAIPISQKTGLKKIKTLIKNLSRLDYRSRGRVIKKRILRDYLKFNLKSVDIKKLKPIKIAIDTANAVPAILVSEISKKIPGRVYPLFLKLDGNFPNHPPDPLVKENLRTLQKKVKLRQADLGVAFDGDGDRIIFVDEKGEIISGDLITAFLSSLILAENPGAKILYDVRSSRIVKEVIKKGGGRALVWKVGHSLIKEKMRREDVIFAGEFSGHYYHKEHYFSEAPLFVLFKILEAISKTKKNLSELIQPLKKYFSSGEINFKVKNKKKILEFLERKYKDGKISHLDGLRVDFKDWWFLVRPSGTEDLLRLLIEAETKELMKKKKKELIRAISPQP